MALGEDMEEKWLKRIRRNARSLERRLQHSTQKSARGNNRSPLQSPRKAALTNRLRELGATGRREDQLVNDLDEVAEICERYLDALRRFAGETRRRSAERLLVELELVLDHLAFHHRGLRRRLSTVVESVYEVGDRMGKRRPAAR